MAGHIKPRAAGLTVLVDPPNPVLDIVFVHGFTGDPEHTWTYKSERRDNGGSGHRNKIYWPSDLVPSTLPNARVLTYGYDTHIRHLVGPPLSQNTLYDFSNDFLISLEANRRCDSSRPLLFIVHSLGGILIKEALRQARNSQLYQNRAHSIYLATHGIMFFGTPHRGADPRPVVRGIVQRLGRILGVQVNEQILQTLTPSSERLKELRDGFVPMARERSWVIYSFQEQYGPQGLGSKVVEDVSSCLDDRMIEITQHIASNHMDMCRFSGLDNSEYRKVAAGLERMVQDIEQNPGSLRPPNIDPSRERAIRKKQIRSLTFDQIEARQMTIKEAHDKTCQWLLITEEFQSWLKIEGPTNQPRLFWIKGHPGTGKSTIMKFLLEQTMQKSRNATIISFFFNARGSQLEKSVLGMYRSLLHQIFKKLPSLHYLLGPVIDPETDEYISTESITWHLEQARVLFAQVVRGLGHRQLICFIDALDECCGEEIREMVESFQELLEATSESPMPFIVCFSSRHYPSISTGNTFELKVEDHDGHTRDIRHYVHSKLRIGSDNMTSEVKEKVLRKAARSFLWIVLVIPMLKKAFDSGKVHALQRLLSTIPTKLEDLFLGILERDDEDLAELTLCLQWVLHAECLLHPYELYFAIISGTAPEDLKALHQEMPSEETVGRFLTTCSKGLVQTTKSLAPKVQFIHESVRDFLLKDGLRALQTKVGGTFLEVAQERLKQCCDQYLRSMTKFWVSEMKDCLVSLPDGFSLDRNRVRPGLQNAQGFLDYAVRNVLRHADAAEAQGVSQSSFLSSFALRDWVDLANYWLISDGWEWETLDINLLYVLARVGFLNLLRTQLAQVPDIDIEGGRFCFPTGAALKSPYEFKENVLKTLLKPRAGPRPSTDTKMEALLSTVTEPFNDTLQFILKHGHRDYWANKPLWTWAFSECHLPVIKVLYRTGKVNIKPNKEVLMNCLFLATEGGHTAAVEPLLQFSSLDLNWHFQGQTLLMRASQYGDITLTKLLLETGNVDTQSALLSYAAPIELATEYGHYDLLRLLLEANRTSHVPYDHRVLLTRGVLEGNESLVKVLLEVGNADIERDECFWRILLIYAAQNGDATMSRLLTDASGVDVGIVDLDHSAASEYTETDAVNNVTELFRAWR